MEAESEEDILNSSFDKFISQIFEQEKDDSLSSDIGKLNQSKILNSESFDEFLKKEQVNFDAIFHYFHKRVKEIQESSGKNPFEGRDDIYDPLSIKPYDIVHKAVYYFLNEIVERGEHGLSKKTANKYLNQTPYKASIVHESVFSDISDMHLPLFMHYNWINMILRIKDGKEKEKVPKLTFDIIPILIDDEEREIQYRKELREEKKKKGAKITRNYKPFSRFRTGKKDDLNLNVPKNDYVHQVAKQLDVDKKIKNYIEENKDKVDEKGMKLTQEQLLSNAISYAITNYESNGTRGTIVGNRLLLSCLIRSMREIWMDPFLFTKQNDLEDKEYPERYTGDAFNIIEELYPLYFISLCNVILRISSIPFVDISFINYIKDTANEDKTIGRIDVIRYSSSPLTESYLPDEESIYRQITEQVNKKITGLTDGQIEKLRSRITFKEIKKPIGMTFIITSKNRYSERRYKWIDLFFQAKEYSFTSDIFNEYIGNINSDALKVMKKEFIFGIISMTNSTMDQFKESLDYLYQFYSAFTYVGLDGLTNIDQNILKQYNPNALLESIDKSKGYDPPGIIYNKNDRREKDILRVPPEYFIDFYSLQRYGSEKRDIMSPDPYVIVSGSVPGTPLSSYEDQPALTNGDVEELAMLLDSPIIPSTDVEIKDNAVQNTLNNSDLGLYFISREGDIWYDQSPPLTSEGRSDLEEEQQQEEEEQQQQGEEEEQQGEEEEQQQEEEEEEQQQGEGEKDRDLTDEEMQAYKKLQEEHEKLTKLYENVRRNYTISERQLKAKTKIASKFDYVDFLVQTMAKTEGNPKNQVFRNFIKVTLPKLMELSELGVNDPIDKMLDLNFRIGKEKPNLKDIKEAKKKLNECQLMRPSYRLKQKYLDMLSEKSTSSSPGGGDEPQSENLPPSDAPGSQSGNTPPSGAPDPQGGSPPTGGTSTGTSDPQGKGATSSSTLGIQGEKGPSTKPVGPTSSTSTFSLFGKSSGSPSKTSSNKQIDVLRDDYFLDNGLKYGDLFNVTNRKNISEKHNKLVGRRNMEEREITLSDIKMDTILGNTIRSIYILPIYETPSVFKTTANQYEIGILKQIDGDYIKLISGGAEDGETLAQSLERIWKNRTDEVYPMHKLIQRYIWKRFYLVNLIIPQNYPLDSKKVDGYSFEMLPFDQIKMRFTYDEPQYIYQFENLVEFNLSSDILSLPYEQKGPEKVSETVGQMGSDSQEEEQEKAKSSGPRVSKEVGVLDPYEYASNGLKYGKMIDKNHINVLRKNGKSMENSFLEQFDPSVHYKPGTGYLSDDFERLIILPLYPYNEGDIWKIGLLKKVKNREDTYTSITSTIEKGKETLEQASERIWEIKTKKEYPKYNLIANYVYNRKYLVRLIQPTVELTILKYEDKYDTGTVKYFTRLTYLRAITKEISLVLSKRPLTEGSEYKRMDKSLQYLLRRLFTLKDERQSSKSSTIKNPTKPSAIKKPTKTSTTKKPSGSKKSLLFDFLFKTKEDKKYMLELSEKNQFFYQKKENGKWFQKSAGRPMRIFDPSKHKVIKDLGPNEKIDPLKATFALLFFKDNEGEWRILLGQERYDSHKGQLGLPGGNIEPKKTIYGNLAKEFQEEMKLFYLTFRSKVISEYVNIRSPFSYTEVVISNRQINKDNGFAPVNFPENKKLAPSYNEISKRFTTKVSDIIKLFKSGNKPILDEFGNSISLRPPVYISLIDLLSQTTERVKYLFLQEGGGDYGKKYYNDDYSLKYPTVKKGIKGIGEKYSDFYSKGENTYEVFDSMDSNEKEDVVRKVVKAKKGISIFDTDCIETFGSAHHFCSSYVRRPNDMNSLVSKINAYHEGDFSVSDAMDPSHKQRIASQEGFYEEGSDDYDYDEEIFNGHNYEDHYEQEIEEPSFLGNSGISEEIQNIDQNNLKDDHFIYENYDNDNDDDDDIDELYEGGDYEHNIGVKHDKDIIDIKNPMEYGNNLNAGDDSMGEDWTLQVQDSSDPWDEYIGDGYESMDSGIYYGYTGTHDPYSYGTSINNGNHVRRYYSNLNRINEDDSEKDSQHSFSFENIYIENVNSSLSMLVAGVLTIVSKNLRSQMQETGKEMARNKSNRYQNDRGNTKERYSTQYVEKYAKSLSAPKSFTLSCQRIQKSSEEALHMVYQTIFSHWALLKPNCDKREMENYVTCLSKALENGNIIEAEKYMEKICKTIRLSDSTIKTMKLIVEQMHKAVARYRCSHCKDMKQFKDCVVEVNEMVVTTSKIF